MAEFEKAADKRAYLLDNIADIKKDSKAYSAGGGTIKGMYIILGENCVVQVREVATYKDGSRTWQVATLATTSIHALDGVNLWVTAVDSNRPGEVVYSNVLVGEHALQLVDMVNLRAGEALMAATWRSAVELSVAEKLGVSLDEHLAGVDLPLLKVREIFRVMDVFVPGAVALRRLLGPNMAAETVLITNDTTSGKDASEVLDALMPEELQTNPLPATTDPPAVIVEGIEMRAAEFVAPQDMSLAGDFLLNPISPADRELIAQQVDDTCRASMTMEDQTGLRGRIQAIVQEKMKSIGNKDQPTGQIHNELWSTSDLAENVRAEMRRRLTEDLIPTVQDNVAHMPDLAKKYGPALIDMAVCHIAERRTVGALCAPGGLAELWAHQTIEPQVASSLANVDMVKELAALMDDANVAEKAREEAAARLTVLPVDSAERKAAEKNLEEAGRALAQSQEKRAAATELDDIKQNEVERAEALERETEEERRRAFEPEGPRGPPLRLLAVRTAADRRWVI